MKIILPILFLLASCSPSRYLECPKYVGVVVDTIPVELPRSEYTLEVKESAYLRPPVDADSLPPCRHGVPNCKCIRLLLNKPDTVPEWMHVSMRDVGFVVARKALSVRVDGVCSQHLDCSGKPFPAHYKVGWCEGKELLLNRLVKGRMR